MVHTLNAILSKDFLLRTKVKPNKVHSTTQTTIKVKVTGQGQISVGQGCSSRTNFPSNVSDAISFTDLVPRYLF